MVDSFFCLIDNWLRLNETDVYLPCCFATELYFLLKTVLQPRGFDSAQPPWALNYYSKTQDPLAEHTALSWRSGAEAQIIRNLNP